LAFEQAAKSLDNQGESKQFTLEELESLAELASELDSSDNPVLQKKASLLDEILLTISAPKGAAARIKAARDEELDKLYHKYRLQTAEKLYSNQEELAKLNQIESIAKDVEKGIKEYRPLQYPMSTRYSPDHPGVMMIRLADNLYQDPITGKQYNYEEGYTLDDGTKVPGGSVIEQTKLQREMGASPFTTREDVIAEVSAR
jgi:uncharacterized protein (UPF0305 family)